MSSPSLLPASWPVPSTFRDRLGDEVGRQRTMDHEGHLLLILHALPRHDELERSGRFFWREPDGTWHAAGDEGENEKVGIEPMHRHLKEFEDAVEQLEDREQLTTSAAEYFEILRDIVPLRRAARCMRNALQAARESVPGARDVITCRDRAESIERGAELVGAEAQNGLDFAMARHAEEQARHGHEMAIASHRLNRLVAIFFPIATIATIFGINVESGLEKLYAPVLFWAILASTIVIGLVLNRMMMANPRSPVRVGGNG